MDEADITSERQAFLDSHAVQNCRKPEGPKPTGRCLNCGESLPDQMRWCDGDCREDWLKRAKGRKCI